MSDGSYNVLRATMSPNSRRKHLPSSSTLSKKSKQLSKIAENELLQSEEGIWLEDLTVVCKYLLSMYQQETGNIPAGVTVKFKLSADGTVTGRKRNSGIAITMEMVEPTLKTRRVARLAVVKGNETMENKQLVAALHIVDTEILRVQKNGLTGVHYVSNICFIFCADYKFMLLALGLSAANADYACVFCKVHKSNRHAGAADPRTIEEIISIGQQLEEGKKLSASARQSIRKKPLLTAFEMSAIVVDDMHMTLRIFDVLFNAVKAECSLRNLDLSSALTNVLSRKVVLKETDSTILCSTFLNLKDRMNIMSNLNLVGLEDYCSLMKQLVEILNYGNSFPGMTKAQYEIVNEKCKTWLASFLILFQKKEVTPYIYIFAHHWPDQLLATRGLLHKFNQQGVEYENISVRKDMQSYGGKIKHIMIKSVKKRLLDTYVQS